MGVTNIITLHLQRTFIDSFSFSLTDDFKPASVDTSRPAELVVGDKNDITVTVPHIQVIIITIIIIIIIIDFIRVRHNTGDPVVYIVALVNTKN